MVKAVLESIAEALRESGIDTAMQYGDDEARSGGVLVCVGLRSGKILGSGAGDYLGLEIDADSGAVRELYGFRAEMSVALDIYAESAQDCRDGLSRVMAALQALPKAIKGRTLECGELCYENEAELFRIPAELECIAYLCAERDEGTEEFEDFTLRGVLK
jgi:hypothetical protein